MRPFNLRSAAAAATVAFLLLGAASAVEAPAVPGALQYDAGGRLILPADYREWIFLSSGLDMSYNPLPAMPGGHMFDNVFVPQAAYLAFKKTGVWPDKTVLLIEARGGATDVSIAKRGVVQAQDVMGYEAHVKDSARGGWVFFGFDGDKPAEMIPTSASCYSCHQAHGAADTTFVQFYPTLLPIATKLGTLNPAYVAETAGKK
jgi:hypothetical protein